MNKGIKKNYEYTVYPLEGIWDISEEAKKKKPHKLLDEVQFIEFKEGKCIQMMHLGS